MAFYNSRPNWITLATTEELLYMKANIKGKYANMMPHEKRLLTITLNARQGKAHVQSPAQRRGRLLGSFLFRTTGMIGVTGSLINELPSLLHTDLSAEKIDDILFALNLVKVSLDNLKKEVTYEPALRPASS